ncbi:hypothetical protein BIW11_12822 [Tropilaelaps mercedesae]|uniref:Uncharacterized protein n=1 Tax=Tropilaelaps mercedesae TaxID=418985 RepID=A0A1V9X589_9ACAR|nr:hypothetical protein BIW11_12822 [Tropilaelaps mercedesae]
MDFPALTILLTLSATQTIATKIENDTFGSVPQVATKSRRKTDRQQNALTDLLHKRTPFPRRSTIALIVTPRLRYLRATISIAFQHNVPASMDGPIAVSGVRQGQAAEIQSSGIPLPNAAVNYNRRQPADATQRVNFVLTKEGFVYPAVFLRFFISWQALCGAVALSRMALRSRRHPRCTRAMLWGVIPLLPLVTLHAYAGSKALADLPVPVFMALQSATSLINWGLDAVQNIDHKAGQRCMSQLSVFVLSVFAVSSVLLHLPLSLSSGTSWMTMHVLSLASVKYLESNTVNQCVKANVQLRELTYNCAVLITLTSTSFVTGDYFHVFEAPHFRRFSFWAAFLISGVACAFLAGRSWNLFSSSVVRAGTALIALLLFGTPQDVSNEVNIWMILLFLCVLRLHAGPPPLRAVCTHEVYRVLSHNGQNHDSDSHFQAII